MAGCQLQLARCRSRHWTGRKHNRAGKCRLYNAPVVSFRPEGAIKTGSSILTELQFPNATYPNATSPDPGIAKGFDGIQSPPYYPSPWGSGSGDWANAYERARAFVSQMNLLEKVNLTTGVGYVIQERSRFERTLTVTTDGKRRDASVKLGLFHVWGFHPCACKIHLSE